MTRKAAHHVEIVLEPGRVWQREELAPATIALDGAVEGPWLDAEGQRYSFDHHHGCIRMITSATCQQVLDAIVLGLDPRGFRILLNDVDGDTVLATWLLQHAERWRSRVDLARVRPLVAAVATVDAHGPAMPVADVALARHFYVRVLGAPAERKAGRTADGARPYLEACLDRLESWWATGLGADAEAPPWTALPQLVEFGDWVLADASGAPDDARVAAADWLYERGWDRWVQCRRQTTGRYLYSIGKRSDLVAGFPLADLYEALNRAEAEARGRDLGAGERWGGGSSIGGSPRDGGSVLHPDVVSEVVDHVVRRRKRRRRQARPRGTLAALSILLAALAPTSWPATSEAGVGRSVARGAAKGLSRQAAKPAVRESVKPAAGQATAETRKAAERAAAARLQARDAAGHARSPVRPAPRAQTTFRYTTRERAHREASRGIPAERHMTSRAGPGRPLGAEAARRRYGLPQRPDVRMTVDIPRGHPVRRNRAVGGAPGIGEMTSPQRLPPDAVRRVVPLK